MTEQKNNIAILLENGSTPQEVVDWVKYLERMRDEADPYEQVQELQTENEQLKKENAELKEQVRKWAEDFKHSILFIKAFMLRN